MPGRRRASDQETWRGGRLHMNFGSPARRRGVRGPTASAPCPRYPTTRSSPRRTAGGRHDGQSRAHPCKALAASLVHPSRATRDRTSIDRRDVGRAAAPAGCYDGAPRAEARHYPINGLGGKPAASPSSRSRFTSTAVKANQAPQAPSATAWRPAIRR